MNRKGFLLSLFAFGLVAIGGIVLVVVVPRGGAEPVTVQALVQDVIHQTETYRDLQTLLQGRIWFVRGAGVIIGLALGSLLGGVGSFLHYRRKLET